MKYLATFLAAVMLGLMATPAAQADGNMYALTQNPALPRGVRVIKTHYKKSYHHRHYRHHRHWKQHGRYHHYRYYSRPGFWFYID